MRAALSASDKKRLQPNPPDTYGIKRPSAQVIACKPIVTRCLRKPLIALPPLVQPFTSCIAEFQLALYPASIEPAWRQTILTYQKSSKVLSRKSSFLLVRLSFAVTVTAGFPRRQRKERRLPKPKTWGQAGTKPLLLPSGATSKRLRIKVHRGTCRGEKAACHCACLSNWTQKSRCALLAALGTRDDVHPPR